ncbi:MAG: SDR family oxidoreductase [Chloroflexota bacterium]|nr:SDR family oxidoreductase [Chloroflexota bacterium]PLS79508.1 MAG: 3-oxoacyl-ACP reductase [Chloroflexota bacterium]
MDFSNQVVLVTGASGSIGQAIVRGFAQAGARVAIHFHSGQAAAEQLRASLPGTGHMLVPANIAQPGDVKRMVDEVVAASGRLDVLVNNAAIFVEHPVAEMSYGEWNATFERVIQVNLLGAANASYCAARQMMAQGGGRIVNVGSRGAYRGEPRATSYGASKAALHALSQSLAQELAPHNIFVTAVAPGFVEGGMATESLTGARGEAIRAQSPLGRVAKPEEVAHTVLFLAAPGSEFLTGGVIDINGASYLR